MRNILVLIILAGIGYYTWQKHPEYFTKFLPKQEAAETEVEDPALAEAEPAPVAPAPAAPATPAPPTFQSRIAVPVSADGTKTLAPGQFLVIERASVETKDGVTAIVPGDLVKLIERRPNGSMQVTNGTIDFVVKESQVTQDVTVAQDAERREYQRRYGNLVR